MTDFEINKAVADKLGISHKCDMGTVIIRGDSGCKSFDPCNNVEQAWEIMMKYGIGVVKNNSCDSWIAISAIGEYEHEKPLAAAMLCFLEM